MLIKSVAALFTYGGLFGVRSPALTPLIDIPIIFAPSLQIGHELVGVRCAISLPSRSGAGRLSFATEWNVVIQRRIDAFESLIVMAMAFIDRRGAPPAKVRLPRDEAGLLLQSPFARFPHGVVRDAEMLEQWGSAGMTVEIHDDPAADITLFR